jgi:hypothetical protein
MHRILIATLALASLCMAAAYAGPPLICRPLQIGTAQSLPWNDANGWNGMLPSYDTGRLVSDTLSLMTPATPVEVRMETLRRAAIYSSRNPRLADELAAQLFERKAWFEAGYFVEAVREATQAYAMLRDPSQKAAWHLRTVPPYIASRLAPEN